MARSAAKLAEEADGPERTCAVTRQHRSPDEMIRFVLSPDGAVVPDLKRKLPGRGLWVTADAGTVAEAVRKGVFSKGFKKTATAGPDLPAQIDQMLSNDVLQSLAMANKAGVVSAGAFQVEKALADGHIGAVFHAADGSRDGVRKIRQFIKRFAEEPEKVEIVDFFDSEQIGLALGRASVVHAALRRGAVTQALMARVRKLAVYRGLHSGIVTAERPIAEGMDPDGSEDGHRPGIEN